MRILHLARYYAPTRGGTETVLRQLCRGLTRHTEVMAVVTRDGGQSERETLEGVEVVRLPSLGKWRGAPLSVGLVHAIRNSRADLIHLHHPHPQGVLALLVSGMKVPWICWWHSDIVRQRVLGRLFGPFLKHFLSRCVRILVAGPQLIENTMRLEGFRERCQVVPFGIDPRAYGQPDRQRVDELRQRYGSRLVLAVGRLVYYKGIEHLVAAMRNVKGQCVIVGDGPLRERLETQVAQLGLKDRVHLVGEADHLSPYYQACEVFVLPSTAVSEAFGMVQLEAMACGKPVVNTSLRSAVPWVSQDKVTGLTVPPADPMALAGAINRLLDEPALRERYGQAARQRVEEHFTVEKMVAGTLAVYEEVLGRKLD